MTFFIAVLIITGLHMSWWWYLLAVVVYIFHFVSAPSDHQVRTLDRKIDALDGKFSRFRCNSTPCHAQTCRAGRPQ